VEQEAKDKRSVLLSGISSNENQVKLAVSLFLFLLPFLSVFATDSDDPVPDHVRPCLASLPILPKTVGKSSIVVMDRDNECTILILFELQSDLENYRRARIRSKLSPESIDYKRPDGSMLKIKLELRQTAVW